MSSSVSKRKKRYEEPSIESNMLGNILRTKFFDLEETSLTSPNGEKVNKTQYALLAISLWNTGFILLHKIILG